MFSVLLFNFLLVTAAEVKIDNFFQVDDQPNCNGTRRVQWQPINTGNCSVEYTIEFRNNINGTIGTEESITGNFYCTSKYDNATSVIMWATYEGTQGFKSDPRLLTAAPVPPTTTTTRTSYSGKRHFVNSIKLY